MEEDRDRQAALTSHPRGSEFDGALAGLWENWLSPAANGVRSFAIITTKPNEVCGVHDRKPVVLGPEGVASLGRLGNSGPVPRTRGNDAIIIAVNLPIRDRNDCCGVGSETADVPGAAN